MVKRASLFLLSLLLLASAVQGQALTHTVRMGVVLPLKEKTSRGAKMIEFYQGLLMAVDSVKRQGCSVEVTALHSGSSAAAMDSLLMNAPLGQCDVIFGPLDASQLPALADYCDLRGIRLVVPFSSLTTQVGGHPLHYLVNAPRHAVQKQASWYVQALYPNDNFVVLESGEKNEEGANLVERVRAEMDGNNIYVRQLSISANDSIFTEALDTEKTNVILVNSSTLNALHALLNKLRPFAAQHPQYRFSLFGYPAWQSYAAQTQNDLYRFDTYIYATFYRDPLDKRVTDFEQRFESNFGRAVSATFPRYGLFGFDLGYYFLSGLGLFGDQLEAHLTDIPYTPLQHALEFQSQGDADGYINHFVQLVHYDSNQSTEILYRKHE